MESSSSSVEESSSSELSQGIAAVASAVQAFRYVSHEARLEIFAENVHRLDIFAANGNVVKATEAVSQSSVDLSSLKPGMYVVRLVVPGHVYQQVFVKK